MRFRVRRVYGLSFFVLFLAASQAFADVPREERWVMFIYEKGKRSYDFGDYTAAVHEWNRLEGTLDRYPVFKKMIDYLTGREKSISGDEVNLADRKLDVRIKRGSET